MNRAQQDYILWLRRNDPFLLDVVLKRLNANANKPTGLGGISDILSSIKKIDFKKLTSTVVDTAAKLATTKAQIKVLNEQTKRAVSGQPPIDMTYYPTAPVYNAETLTGQQASTAAAQQLNRGFSVGSTLPYVALALGAGLLLMKLRNR